VLLRDGTLAEREGFLLSDIVALSCWLAFYYDPSENRVGQASDYKEMLL